MRKMPKKEENARSKANIISLLNEVIYINVLKISCS